jgi:hypothetical protein
MAKSSKKSKEAARLENGSTLDGGLAASTPGKHKSIAGKGSTAKRSKASGKSAPGTAGKVPAARKPRARKKQGAAHGVISDEDIRLRAYFISLQRHQNGVPGDSAHDWLEARRQLQEEAGKNV